MLGASSHGAHAENAGTSERGKGGLPRAGALTERVINTFIYERRKFTVGYQALLLILTTHRQQTTYVACLAHRLIPDYRSGSRLARFRAPRTRPSRQRAPLSTHSLCFSFMHFTLPQTICSFQVAYTLKRPG